LSDYYSASIFNFTHACYTSNPYYPPLLHQSINILSKYPDKHIAVVFREKHGIPHPYKTTGRIIILYALTREWDSELNAINFVMNVILVCFFSCTTKQHNVTFLRIYQLSLGLCYDFLHLT
jgi:hypothetical protein